MKKLISFIVASIFLVGLTACGNSITNRVSEYTENIFPESKNVEVIMNKDKGECSVFVEYLPSRDNGKSIHPSHCYPMGFGDDDCVNFSKEIKGLLTESGYTDMVVKIYMHLSDGTISVCGDSDENTFTNWGNDLGYNVEYFK